MTYLHGIMDRTCKVRVFKTVLEAQGKHLIYLKTSAEAIDLGSYIIRIGMSQSSSVSSCLLPALVFFDFHGNACVSIFFDPFNSLYLLQDCGLSHFHPTR